MKKILTILIIISLFLVACSPKEEVHKEEAPKFTTLQQVMDEGLSYQCNFKDAGTTVTTKIKGSNFISTTSTPNGIVKTIVKDNMVYTWIEGQKEGYTMDLDRMDEMASELPDASMTAPEYDKQLDLDCRPQMIEDREFEAPRDINFQDLTKLLEGLLA